MILRQIFIRHLEAEKTVIHEFSGDFDADYKKLEDDLIPAMNRCLSSPIQRGEWLEDDELCHVVHCARCAPERCDDLIAHSPFHT